MGNAKCMICNGKIPGWCRIICGNFGSCANQGKMCQNTYHVGCYRKHKRDVYPVLAFKDLDDSLMDDSKIDNEYPKRFKV